MIARVLCIRYYCVYHYCYYYYFWNDDRGSGGLAPPCLPLFGSPIFCIYNNIIVVVQLDLVGPNSPRPADRSSSKRKSVPPTKCKPVSRDRAVRASSIHYAHIAHNNMRIVVGLCTNSYEATARTGHANRISHDGRPRVNITLYCIMIFGMSSCDIVARESSLRKHTHDLMLYSNINMYARSRWPRKK